MDVGCIGLGEDGPDGGGDHLGRALGHPGEDVSEEVDPAALDGRAGHGRLDGLTQPQVGIGDDQLHPAKPTGLQAAQERGPEGPVLAVAHREAEDLAAAITTHPGGHHDRLGDDPAVDPGFAVGGVHKDVREGLAGQGTVPEGRRPRRPGRRRCGRPRTWRCRCRRPAPGPGRRPCGWRPRADRPPSPPRTAPGRPAGGAPTSWGRTTPPAAWGSAAPDPQPWLPTAVAGGRCAGQPRLGPLVWGGTDHAGELGLDQGLVDGLGGLADAVIDLRGLECVQDLQQCRLVKGHRALCPFARTICRGLADHRTVALPTCAATSSWPCYLHHSVVSTARES